MAFDLVRERMRRHFVRHAQPEDVVRMLVAVQAQDYLGSLWALGLRTKNATETKIEEAIARKKIVRTWPLRNTLHFVLAEDLRWILAIAGSVAIARAGARHRQLGLDDATFTKSRNLFEHALAGGRLLSRKEMYEVLARGKISPEGQRGIHILGRLAQEAVICFGPRRKKEQTFALADEWLPKTKKRTREEGLGELARRYFAGHGPATLEDFRWWSGLRARDARDAVGLAERELDHETVRDRTYYFSSNARSLARCRTQLLPAFDEYLVGYKDRDALLKKAPRLAQKTLNAGGGMLAPTVIVDGQVVGTWKRTLGSRVAVKADIVTKISKSDREAVEDAARAYGKFLGLDAAVV